MASPLVSVVLCTFNRADLVVRTLSAVLAQEGVDLEVVVVDDGSTDATPETLAEVAEGDPRVRPVHQVNAGLSAARKRGAGRGRRWMGRVPRRRRRARPRLAGGTGPADGRPRGRHHMLRRDPGRP